MPFRSEKQRRYLWAKEPDIAREWTDEHGSKPKRLASGGMIKKAIANKMKLVDYSHMRAGGMIGDGSLTPLKVEKFQDQVCRKASKGF
jgi:hypothetical protein|tara:strand:- start:2686 stop:2949 length:264 start_codon:yes stop_codon:yes gene_type:complete